MFEIDNTYYNHYMLFPKSKSDFETAYYLHISQSIINSKIVISNRQWFFYNLIKIITNLIRILNLPCTMINDKLFDKFFLKLIEVVFKITERYNVFPHLIFLLLTYICMYIHIYDVKKS